jgi:hypothetical protein
MIDYTRILNNWYGLGSSLKLKQATRVDTETEIRLLRGVVEVQKVELRRFRRLLGEGLLHPERGTDNDLQPTDTLS